LCMFSVPKSEREKKWKNCQIHTCGFHCIAKHKEGSLKLCALLVLCSQIWLNLRRAIATFYTSSKFQWMIATLATNRNAPQKKNTGEYSPLDFRATYVTAEVHDLLMHVAYWELSGRSPTSSPCRAMPHTLLTFSAVVMSLSAVIIYSSRPASLVKTTQLVRVFHGTHT
jgi:hypothetical protein